VPEEAPDLESLFPVKVLILYFHLSQAQVEVVVGIRELLQLLEALEAAQEMAVLLLTEPLHLHLDKAMLEETT
jgi:hypothetical protein